MSISTTRRADIAQLIGKLHSKEILMTVSGWEFNLLAVV